MPVLQAIQIPQVNTGLFAFGPDTGATDGADSRVDWHPNADASDHLNPQRMALDCEADELYYGGAAGGGKTDLLIGCALTQHRRAVIFRRVHPNLREIIDRSIMIVDDGGDAFNRGQSVWRLPWVRLEFESCQHEFDKRKQQGRARDFYGFDEITEFTRTQYQFIIGWNRTEKKTQRCRVIVTGNPPLDSDGMWIVEEWAPWLDPDFEAPAEPGELRWYHYDSDGHIHWTDTDDAIDVDGDMIKPRSRTFIPAKLSDNPHLAADGRYLSVLNSLPEPMRTRLKDGDFSKMQGMDPWQVIPTEWVRQAQARWREQEAPTTPPDAVGVDVARGGQDATAMAPRWDDYFGTVIKYPGVATPDGPTVAGLVYQLFPEALRLMVDVIGVGSSEFDSLRVMYPAVLPVNVSVASNYTDRSGKLKMRNLRSELYWRMRDSLDPEYHSEVALPPGREVLADLCSARYAMMAGGIVAVESKDDIKARLGRSPDVGDAILLSNHRKSGSIFL